MLAADPHAFIQLPGASELDNPLLAMLAKN